MSSTTFWVPGQPRPKGSMAIIPRRHARPIVRNGECYYRISDLYNGPNRSVRKGKHVDLLAPWVTALKAEALYHKPRGQGLPGAFGVEAVFYLKRPAKSKHGDQPLGPPDVDKLLRAVGDALTGMFYIDDAQVLHWRGEKRWSDERGPGALITINHEDEQTNLL